MLLMLVGLLLFTATHLYLSLATADAERWRQKLSANGFKAVIAFKSAVGLVLIVFGWRSSQPEWLYTPGPALHSVGMALVAVAVYLFVVANRPSGIKRLLRHPQLTGVLLWCIGHLMLNGDSRSLLLFGWLGVWSVAEMLTINRRDGIWIKTAAPGFGTELITVIVAALVLGVLAYAHVWLAGVAILPPL
jgi:uncharacterized membrane protein